MNADNPVDYPSYYSGENLPAVNPVRELRPLTVHTDGGFSSEGGFA